MPWREGGPMEERVRFVTEWERGLYQMSELCERFGVSRKTGYKWLGRWEAEGAEGLGDRSRAPQCCPHRVREEVAARLIELRQRHPDWGPRKLLEIVREREPAVRWPAASTMGELFKRSGLVGGRRRRRRSAGGFASQTAARAPNDVWTVDFKGQFRLGDGVVCYPLTIMDRVSRFILACEACRSTEQAGVRAAMERVFREAGLPEVVRTDNGVPFVVHGLVGLSTLAVWWMRLGIRPERIRPGHPQDNGSHERMHKDLKRTTRPPGRNRAEQQQRFEEFRWSYNHERPHEALGQRPPARVWEPSKRAYPARLREPEYPGYAEVRLVNDTGTFRFKGKLVFLSQPLAGQRVGLEETDDGVWSIRFFDTLLGRLDEHSWELHA
jgi:putative transposase